MSTPYLLTTATPFNASINERAAMLDKTRWAGVYSYRELQILASYLNAYKIEQGTVIIQEGARELYLCLLIDGKANVLKKDSAGKEKLIATVNAGMTLGEMALIDGQVRSATAIATANSLLLIMTKEEFLRLAEDAPRLAIKLYGYVASLLSQRLRQVSAKLAEYLHEDGYLPT